MHHALQVGDLVCLVYSLYRLRKRPQIEDDFKNEDNLKNEDDLKNEDNLRNEDDLKMKKA